MQADVLLVQCSSMPACLPPVNREQLCAELPMHSYDTHTTDMGTHTRHAPH